MLSVAPLLLATLLFLPAGSARRTNPHPPPAHASRYLSDDEVLRLLIPAYDANRLRASCSRAATSDELDWECYDAWVDTRLQTDLGVPGEDFLVVHVREADGPCTVACQRTVFAVIDTSRLAIVGRVVAEGPLFSETFSTPLPVTWFAAEVHFSFAVRSVTLEGIEMISFRYSAPLECAPFGWTLAFRQEDDTSPSP
jgi:hypothetical protein